MTSLVPTPGELFGPSDEERLLALAFQRGEKGAYQAIYDRYFDRVRNLCRKMLGNADDAAEASQETFLRVYQALARFNGRYQLGPWITRIATNVCLDHLRARSRKPADSIPSDVIEDHATIDDDPESVLIRDVESRQVRKVLAGLPPLHRAAIVLRDSEGLSYSEIAVALEMTEGQVKALLHRARTKFKKTWLSTHLAALFPARLVQKLRGLEFASREQAVNVLSSGAQAASTCNGILQQCGVALSERVATVMTAVLVGTAAAATPAAIPDSTPTETVHVSVTESSGELTRRSPARAKKLIRRDSPVPPDASVPEEVESPEPGPTPDPEPSPSLEPSPGQEGDGAQQPNTISEDVDSPGEAAEPSIALGFDRGAPIPTSVPESNDLSVDCDGQRFEQRLETTISDGDYSYPAVLVLSGGSSLGAELTVFKDERAIYYTGGGALVLSNRAKDRLELEFRGPFGTGSDAASVGLPENGTFYAQFAFDCIHGSLISERLTLSA